MRSLSTRDACRRLPIECNRSGPQACSFRAQSGPFCYNCCRKGPLILTKSGRRWPGSRSGRAVTVPSRFRPQRPLIACGPGYGRVLLLSSFHAHKTNNKAAVGLSILKCNLDAEADRRLTWLQDKTGADPIYKKSLTIFCAL